MHAVGGYIPLPDLDATALGDSEWVILECHRLLASISGAKQLVMNLGLFVIDKVALIDAPNVKSIVKEVANLYV